MAQNYSNHKQWVPAWHFVGTLLLLATIIGSGVNFFKSMDGGGLYSASLIMVASIVLAITYFTSRTFSLKAQDRAIRSEENLRHFVLTGKLLDAKLTIRQVIGLRFAADDEFVDLAQKAATENMSENDIKKAINNWRGDTYRV